MPTFIRLLIFYILLLTTRVFADGDDIRIYVKDASVVNESGGSTTFTIEMSEAPDMCDEVKVDYTTNDISAKRVLDYTETSGSVTFYGFCPNPFSPHLSSKSATLSVPIVDDTTYENRESFALDISLSAAMEGYVISRARGRAIIEDDDALPLKLESFDDTSVEEGDTNRVAYVRAYFNQTLSSDITINFKTEDISAKGGIDYVAQNSGSLLVHSGRDYADIPITIIGDTKPEESKDFKIIIDSITGGTVEPTASEAIVTIEDDDAIEVSVSCSDQEEGDVNDSNKMECYIELAKPLPSGEPSLTIDYLSSDGSAPSAKESEDYHSTSGSVTFSTGEQSKVVDIPIIGDNKIEDDESVKLSISGSSYIVQSSSEAMILDDDGDYPSLDLRAGSFSVFEGNSSTTILNFHFKLDKPALADSSFTYFTQDGSAKHSDRDYQEINATLYTVAVGTTDIDINVTVFGDRKIEDDESLYLKFTNLKNLKKSGSRAKGTILNDDGSHPKLSFVLPKYETFEGNSSSRDLNITLHLNRPATEVGSFDYYTQNGSAKDYKHDYNTTKRTTYVINIGEQDITLPVTIFGDREVENDEYFYFKIDNEHNLTMRGTQRVRAYILNDDGSYPKVSISATKTDYLEGDTNRTKVDFSIELDTPATEDNITVKYKSYDDTAKVADSDYVKIPHSIVTFNKGEQKKSLSAYIVADNKVEADEEFYIRLYSPNHAKIDSSNREVWFTILNDDNSSNKAFSCESKMYISSSLNRVTGATNRMWLHEIDTTQNPFTFKILNDSGTTDKYNAIAYNPKDNYIYGLFKNELFRFSKTGDMVNLGTVGGAFPSAPNAKQLYAGAINNKNIYYVGGRVSKTDYLYKIDLLNKDNNVTTLHLSKKVALQDFSFYKNVSDSVTPEGVFLYGVDRGGKLTKIDVRDGTVTQIGNDHIGFEFDSTFSDKNGRFFANDSNGKGFYEFNLKTGKKKLISRSDDAMFNDGANCIDASLVFTDYGDAPSTYGSPKHNIANGIYLGDEVDHDLKSYNTVNADGDDLSGVNDDDGIRLLDNSSIQNTYFRPNTTQTLKVKLSKRAYLTLWLDIDIDGHFDNAKDLLYHQRLDAGEHTITITLPTTPLLKKRTYFRARVSKSSSKNPTDFRKDGEVEDYAVYFGSDTIKGKFNIERTNSGSYPINSNARNAWYTQIVGRDFDYSLVFYKEDFSAEQNISKIPAKIELFDIQNSKTLYERYIYISDSGSNSRFDFLSSGGANKNSPIDDLANLPASKEVIFRITYPKDGSGGVIQSDCKTPINPKLCFDAQTSLVTESAKDKFSIRPRAFYITVADGNIIRKENSASLPNLLNVAAGYDYNLSVIASVYDNNTTASLGYTKTLNGLLEFNTTGTCADSSDRNISMPFSNGKFNSSTFNNDNVGEYILKVVDREWTAIDSNKTTPDCMVGKSDSGGDFNTLVGCNIPSLADVNLRFNPYRFDVNFVLNNLPANSHPDFLYMSELNATENNLSLQFVGTITAQNEKNGTTTNFTAGCMAKGLTLLPDATVETEDGILGAVGGPTHIKTVAKADGTRENVAVARMVEFNGDANDTTFSVVNDIASPLNIAKEKFLDENNGSLHIDLRHNIQKNPSLPINPVQVVLAGLNVDSPQAWSMANSQNQFVPNGVRNLNNTIRNFYFAQVAPDLILYPRVNFAKIKFVRTPLNVDIFCNTIDAYCAKTNIFNNTSIESSPRKQQGWYLSVNHDNVNDGKVTSLTPTPNNVNIAPATPIEFTNGRNGVVITTFNNCNASKVNVTIESTAGLSYNPQGNLPYYSVECTENNASDWAGVGKTGNILEIKPDVDKHSRVDW